jgi:lysyl-tRNA synthetase class 1
MLRKYNFLENGVSKNLLKRIEYTENWFNDFEDKKKGIIELSVVETKALEDLIQVIELEVDPEKIQSQVFEIARNHGLKPGRLFRTIYIALIGKPRGPRLGSYIIDFGRENVIMNLRGVIQSK